MPTIEKLVRRAGYLVDDVLDVDQAIELFNEALEEIDTVYGEAKREVTALAAGVNTLSYPSDVYEVIRVVISIGGTLHEAKFGDVSDTGHYDGIIPSHYTYTRFGEEMQIYPVSNQPVTVTLEYYGANEKLPSVSDDPSLQYTPKLPERYHRALPLYAAVRYFENWEDNPEMRSNYRKQFESIRDDLAYQMERKVRGSKHKTVYVERGWS